MILQPLLRAEITLAPAQELGDTPHGRRRVIPITGGSFRGEKLAGRVLPGGADWQMIRADGVAELDARYTLETDDRALIYVRNFGYRHGPAEVMQRLAVGEPVDPSLYYFRGAATIETSAAELEWMTRSLFIITGERYPSEVVIRFWRVL